MDALDVISLASAKDHLIVEDAFSDAEITRLIKTAVSMVEKYTDYRLYQRDETIIASGCSWDMVPVEIVLIPFTITSVTNGSQPYTDYRARVGALKTTICVPGQSIILMEAGYDNVADIPPPLIDAAYKIITYLYENRDAYEATLPYDIQMMLNPWRRSATI